MLLNNGKTWIHPHQSFGVNHTYLSSDFNMLVESSNEYCSMSNNSKIWLILYLQDRCGGGVRPSSKMDRTSVRSQPHRLLPDPSSPILYHRSTQHAHLSHCSPFGASTSHDDADLTQTLLEQSAKSLVSSLRRQQHWSHLFTPLQLKQPEQGHTDAARRVDCFHMPQSALLFAPHLGVRQRGKNIMVSFFPHLFIMLHKRQ